MATTKMRISPPRFSIECSERQNDIIKKNLEYGMQKRLFNILLDDLCDLIEVHGPGIVHALILGKASFKDHLQDGYIKGLEEAQYIATNVRAGSPVGNRSSREAPSDGNQGSNN